MNCDLKLKTNICCSQSRKLLSSAQLNQLKILTFNYEGICIHTIDDDYNKSFRLFSYNLKINTSVNS